MLTLVKLALRISESAFDAELEALISDCMAELATLGVLPLMNPEDDPQIRTAVISYCKWRFGSAPDAERWEHIYTDKATKLMSATGYGLKEAEDGQI